MSVVASPAEFSVDLPASGSARAAIVLLTLGAEQAGRVLQHLAPEEIRALRDGATELASVSPDVVEALVEAFQSAFDRPAGVEGAAGRMSALLEGALDADRLASVLGEPQSADASGAQALWQAMEALEAKETAEQLDREHPHVVALLMSKISAETAAAIAGYFAVDFRHDVMRRMLGLSALSPSVERLFETHVRRAYLGDAGDAAQGGKHALLADIVNRMDKSASDAIIGAIGEAEPRDAETLKKLLFAFEDVIALAERSRLTLFDAVDTDTVILALRGPVADDLKETVLSALGPRGRRMVEAEIAQPWEGDESEISGARRRIASTALRLAGEGRVKLPEAA